MSMPGTYACGTGTNSRSGGRVYLWTSMVILIISLRPTKRCISISLSHTIWLTYHPKAVQKADACSAEHKCEYIPV
jgi:hypothetical protein